MVKSDDGVEGSLNKGLEIKSISNKDGDEGFIKAVKNVVQDACEEIEFHIAEKEIHPLIEQICTLTDSKAMEAEYRNILDMTEGNHMNALLCKNEQTKMLKILVNHNMWSNYIQYCLKEYIRLLLSNRD
jgi:hypothetical protein